MEKNVRKESLEQILKESHKEFKVTTGRISVEILGRFRKGIPESISEFLSGTYWKKLMTGFLKQFLKASMTKTLIEFLKTF